MEFPFVSRKKYDEIVYKLECLLCHATGGKYSKADYSLNDMCRMVSNYIEQCEYEAEERVLEQRAAEPKEARHETN